MQIILLRDVAGVGQKGSVKNVSDGYALNYLIPNKLAQLATADALKGLEKRLADENARRAAQEKEWEAIVGRMKNFTLLVRARASTQGHLFKKIAAEDIARVLAEQGIDVPADAIAPKMAIKEIGAWPVVIRLGSHEATITVDVIPS
ncbi:MAG TPA: 50S ribosomal protein L9 [Candidatus Paceibacterota bacterium]|nr:50S ribosomal protein L9 [Candidatus Paceibacterota bacterium]